AGARARHCAGHARPGAPQCRRRRAGRAAQPVRAPADPGLRRRPRAALARRQRRRAALQPLPATGGGPAAGVRGAPPRVPGRGAERGGCVWASTVGPSALGELREAFAEADDAPHVSLFPAIAQFGDALIAAGFKDPVLDRDEFGIGHPDLGHLMRELRTIGATNAMATRRRSLTGRARFARAAEAYEPMRRDDGQLPATWEVIYAHAWGPPPGAPIRTGGVDEVSVPLSSIKVRRR